MPIRKPVSGGIPLALIAAFLVLLVACANSGDFVEPQGLSSDSTSLATGPTRVAAPADSASATRPSPSTSPTREAAPQTPMPESSPGLFARVIGVEVSGSPGSYTFVVTVESPDAGCEQYSDWWEVVSGDGGILLYRRVLLHSHTDEQPFTRSGGPVDIGSDEPVAIRAHMSTSGYGQVYMLGSVSGGFESTSGPPFAPELEFEEPLPGDCAF